MALRIAVSIWLIILSILDIRQHRLPHLLTTVPVVGLGISSAAGAVLAWARGDNWVDPAALALAFVAVLASDTWGALVPAAGALGLVLWQGTPSGQIAAVGWLLVLALAKAGIVGAGDSKVVMVLLALFPDIRLVLLMAATAMAVSVTLLVRRLGLAASLLVLNVMRDGLAGCLPARTGEQGVVRIPLVPVLALGSLVYLWGIV